MVHLVGNRKGELQGEVATLIPLPVLMAFLFTYVSHKVP